LAFFTKQVCWTGTQISGFGSTIQKYWLWIWTSASQSWFEATVFGNE